MRLYDGGAVFIAIVLLLYAAEYSSCKQSGLKFRWEINCVEYSRQQSSADQ